MQEVSILGARQEITADSRMEPMTFYLEWFDEDHSKDARKNRIVTERGAVS